MRAIVLAAGLSLTTGLAHAQGALLETLDSLQNVPTAPESRGVKPASFDISARLPPPRSQVETDTCASWAATYAAASFALRRRHPELPDLTLSPAFTYPLAGGGQFCRGYTSISKTLDVLRDKGALPLQEYTFDPGWCARVPTAAQQSRAANFRIAGWQKVAAQDLVAIKGQLADSHPVVFGLLVGPAFNAFRGNGVFNTLENGANTTGHAMVLVGYDDTKSAFRLMNSLGREWGDNGYAWISYDLWRTQVSVGYVIADL